MKIELLKSAFALFLLTTGIVACSSEANIVPLYTATFYGYDDNGENAVVMYSWDSDIYIFIKISPFMYPIQHI